MLDFPFAESPIEERNISCTALLDDYLRSPESTKCNTAELSVSAGESKAIEAIKRKSSGTGETGPTNLESKIDGRNNAAEQRKTDKSDKTGVNSRNESDGLNELEIRNRELKLQLQELGRTRPNAAIGDLEKVVVDTERFIKESRETRTREKMKWEEKARTERAQLTGTVEFGIKNFDQLKGKSCLRAKDQTLLTRDDIDVSCGALLRINPDADVKKYQDLSYLVGKIGRNAKVDSGFPLYIDRGLVKAVSRSDLEGHLRSVQTAP